MELIRSLGLEEAVLAGGVEVDWLMWRCETMAQAIDGVGIEVGLPTRAQAAVISPTAPACVPQDHLEAVLLAHLGEGGTTRVEYATALAGLECRPDGVRAVLRSANGDEREVSAAYLVGADGAHSTVRAELGIAMRGSDDVLSGITSRIRAPLWEALGDLRYGIYAVNHAEAEGLFLPAGPGDAWGYGYLLDPSVRDPELPSHDRLIDRIRLAAGIPDLPVVIERLGSFSSAAQLADRFRHDQVFLVGDAAHRVTPRGGTGMNTAVHDGYDIGWKLAWVTERLGEPSLLDCTSSSGARSPRTTSPAPPIPTGRSAPRRRSSASTWAAGSRTTLTTPEGRVSTLDLLGPGLTLLTGPGGGWRAAADGVPRPPVAVHALDEITARAWASAAKAPCSSAPTASPSTGSRAQSRSPARSPTSRRRGARPRRSPPDGRGRGLYRERVKRLYVLRHAKSAWDDPTLRDRDRPLAPRGGSPRSAWQMGEEARRPSPAHRVLERRARPRDAAPHARLPG